MSKRGIQHMQQGIASIGRLILWLEKQEETTWCITRSSDLSGEHVTITKRLPGDGPPDEDLFFLPNELDDLPEEATGLPGVIVNAVPSKSPRPLPPDAPTVYHVCDPDYHSTGKTKKAGDNTARYHGEEWLWGNVMTNKARGKRNDNEYAIYHSPDGTRLHKVTKASFKQLFRRYEHVTIDMAVPSELRAVLNQARLLNKGQVHNLIKALKGNGHYNAMKFSCQL